MVDGWTTDNGRQRTDDGSCLYYKLTNEPKGSGELKMYRIYKKILHSDEGDFKILVNSGMF